jgi:hypothetical protein
MMMEKPTLDRQKLAKVAMLLTSSQPGEVVAAAGRLVAMLSAAGMSPADFVLNDDDTSSSDTGGKMDDLALRRAHAEAEYFKKEVQRQRKWYEEMLKERDVALARVEELEDALEELQPELDWISLAEAYRRANRRGANSSCGKTMEYLACVGKLTLAHKRTLREFSNRSARGKRKAA